MISIEDDFGLRLINKYHSPSNIYGFILFTEEHPYVKKVLRDEDFWSEFNVKSGANWPIFSVKPLEKKVVSPFPSGSSNSISMMIMASKETKYNNMALRFFNLNDSEDDLPCMIIFALDENNKEIAYQRTYKIKGKTVDEVHQSILSVIESVADVEKVIRENNTQGIQTTPFVAWEAGKSLDKLEFKEAFRKGFYGLGSLTHFIAALIKIIKNV